MNELMHKLIRDIEHALADIECDLGMCHPDDFVKDHTLRHGRTVLNVRNLNEILLAYKEMPPEKDEE